MRVLSWSYSRKLRRNWHIQIQLTRNRSEGKTQRAFKANLDKQASSFVPYTLPFDEHPLRDQISV